MYTVSVTNHWYVGRTELLVTEGQMKFPNYQRDPLIKGGTLNPQWYPSPISAVILPSEKHLFARGNEGNSMPERTLLLKSGMYF